MCLILTTDELEPLVAEEDIEVYKSEAKSFLFGLLCKSSYYNFLYLKGKKTKRVRIKLEYSSFSTFPSIHKGYHAYLESHNLIENAENLGYNLYVFVIPKGTLYYKSDNYVAAEQIIYKGKYKR